MPALSVCVQLQALAMYVFLCLQKFDLCACMANIISVCVCVYTKSVWKVSIHLVLIKKNSLLRAVVP